MFNNQFQFIMKKFENNFSLTAFVATNPEIRSFATCSVARFAVSVSKLQKDSNGNTVTDSEGKVKRTSALLNIEAWRKNDNVKDFDIIKKGALLDFKGYFSPEEWVNTEGVNKNRVSLIANSFDIVDRSENNPETI